MKRIFIAVIIETVKKAGAALESYFKLITLDKYKDWQLLFYSYVRPEGERLKDLWRASGHKSIKRMFEKSTRLLALGRMGAQTDIIDIATISENVVSGGVRRSAMMVICDEDDEEVINAKRNIYKVVDGNWIRRYGDFSRKMSTTLYSIPSAPLRRIKGNYRLTTNGSPVLSMV